MQEGDSQKSPDGSNEAWAAVLTANADLETAVGAAQKALHHAAEHTFEVGSSGLVLCILPLFTQSFMHASKKPELVRCILESGPGESPQSRHVCTELCKVASQALGVARACSA